MKKEELKLILNELRVNLAYIRTKLEIEEENKKTKSIGQILLYSFSALGVLFFIMLMLEY